MKNIDILSVGKDGINTLNQQLSGRWLAMNGPFNFFFWYDKLLTLEELKRNLKKILLVFKRNLLRGSFRP